MKSWRKRRRQYRGWRGLCPEASAVAWGADRKTAIRHHPVFKKGTFGRHPELFDRFYQHASDYLLRKFERSRAILAECEEQITWPAIIGPGFCGATHPGSDAILINTMFEGSKYVYNSDCLYINLRDLVFAVSDPPGVTTSARRLFVELDGNLSSGTGVDLETIVNRINRDTVYDDNATLCLVNIPDRETPESPVRATAFLAGDTILLHGNVGRNVLNRVEGSPHFMGTTHARFKPIQLLLEPDDVLVIASDGILSLLAGGPGKPLESALLEYLKRDRRRFAEAIVQDCNAYYRQVVNGSEIPRFRGNDNTTVVAVFPGDLVRTDGREVFMLGGCAATGT